MARKTKEEAERTYHALLDAATQLFIHQGIAKTTLNDIASAANMTRGAVYWHFNNKDAVIQALWQRNASTLSTTFSSELKQLDPKDPGGHFRNILKKTLHSIVEQPELGQAMRIVMHCVEFTDEQTDLQRFLKRQRDEFFSSMEQAFTSLRRHKALASALPAELLTHSMMGYLHGLVHIYLEPGEKTLDLKKHGHTLMDLLLDAILGNSK